MSNVAYESDKQNMKFFVVFMIALFFLIMCLLGGYYYYQNNSENSSKKKEIAKNNAESIVQTATALEEAGRYQEAVELLETLGEEYKDMGREISIKLDLDLYNELEQAVRDDISKGKYSEAFDYVEKSVAGTHEQKEQLLENIVAEHWSYMQMLFNSSDMSNEKKLVLLMQINSSYLGDAPYNEYQQMFNVVKEAYVYEVFENVQNNIGNKEEQLRILEEGCQLLGDEPLLLSKRAEIQTELDEELVKKAENTIEEAYKSGGYPAAIEIAKDLAKENSRVSKIKELEDAYVDAYVEKSIEDIDSIYKTSGISGVVSSLQAVYSLTNDVKIKKEISTWQNRTIVVKMEDIEPFHKEKIYISDAIEKDNWGDEYNSHIYISDFSRSGYIEYNVKNIEQPKLQFVYYVPKHEASILSEKDSEWEEMRAKIYGDDVEIWSSGTASQKMEPQLISLDVSDYSIVKICLTGVNDSSMYDAWSCHIGDLQFCW